MSSAEQSTIRKMQEHSAAGGAGESSSAGNQMNSGSTGSTNANIRRYLVLLHDCLAIKFVPEREPFHKTNNNNFPNRSPYPITGCSNCPCSPFDTGTGRYGGNIGNNNNGAVGGGGKSDHVRSGSYNATVATSLVNNPCDDDCTRVNCTSSSSCNRSNGNHNGSGNKERKHDWKSNNQSNHHHHHHTTTDQKARSNEEANDRGDHHECQFYRHQANQANYPHANSTQSHLHQRSSSSSSSLLKANNDNNDSEISSPTGDQVNHQILPLIVHNKSNKLGPPSNNKGDYDVMAEHGSHSSCVCSNNSHNGGNWESDQSKHHHQQQQQQQQQQQLHNGLNSKSAYLTKRQQQTDPAHPYNYPPEACNEHLSNHHHSAKGTSALKDDSAIYSGSNNNNNTCRSIKFGHFIEGSGGGTATPSSMLSKVDHSMQALFLYKEFREINLNCFWNSAVHDAFNNLEFKGSIVPSTILVGSHIRKHLTVLKTAWSRKMLRSPAGYTIEFLGEIEELIADPIAKSHFVPLSDSLCWTIHELTSSGQEAFVDDIFLSLASAFPGMALPTKELIYQTLEKLTRERKIYQTPQGYVVVTPDTYRYIMSTEPLLMQASRADYQTNATAANFLRNTILLQQASMQNTPVPPPNQDEDELQDNSNEQLDEKENLDSSGRDDTADCPSPDPDTYSLPYGTFRRYNSLRIKKDVSGKTGCLPRRTLSMRLPKSKSKKSGNISSHSGGDGVDQMCKRADVTGSFQNLDVSQPATVNKELLSRRRKHKSFLSRLLSFRGVRKSSSRKDKSGRSSSGNAANKALPIARSDKSSKGLISFDNNNSNSNETGNKKDEKMPASPSSLVTSPSAGRKAFAAERRSPSSNNLATASTQTSFSIENLNADLVLLSLAGVTSKNSTLERDDSDSGRCTDSHSDADAEITAALNRGLTPTIHDHHHHHHLLHHHHLSHPRDGRRDIMVGRSHSSCNVYEKIENDLGLKVDVDECDGRSPRSPSSQMSVSPSPSTFTTASAIYSNNRGNHQHHSNNSNRHNLYSRCHSSASSSGYSYKDFYNLYRRRYPSYQPSTPTSLEYPEMNEGLRFRPQQPIRYPPRSFERKQIFDEINRGSFKEKKQHRSKTVVISNNVSSGSSGADNNEKLSNNAGQHHSSESILTVKTSNNNNNNNNNNRNDNGMQQGEKVATTKTTETTNSATAPMTTILSQTLRNTTNLELEFRLPLGNIFSAALGSGNATMSASSSSSFPACNDKLSSERSTLNESESRGEHPHKTTGITEERERYLSEVDTMVNDLFTIKSFVKTSPLNDELSSTIEFKTRASNSSSRGNNCGSNGQTNNNSNLSHSNAKTTYIIEAVSSKPFADIHTTLNRESEII